MKFEKQFPIFEICSFQGSNNNPSDHTKKTTEAADTLKRDIQKQQHTTRDQLKPVQKIF